MTCGKAREFLAQEKVDVTEETDATKEKLGPERALALARAAAELYVAKGKKVVHVDLRKETPSDEELLKLLLGPSGNLRAPTVRKGSTLLIGFEAGAYERVLKKR